MSDDKILEVPCLEGFDRLPTPSPTLGPGQNVQRKSTIGKPGPPIDTERERIRHVQVQEEKEKGIYEYMCYRRQKLHKKKIEFIFRKMKEDNYPGGPLPPNFMPLHKPPITPEILKAKAERRENKQQVYEIICEGVGDTMRKASSFCRHTRPEYISNLVLMSLSDKLRIEAHPSYPNTKK